MGVPRVGAVWGGSCWPGAAGVGTKSAEAIPVNSSSQSVVKIIASCVFSFSQGDGIVAQGCILHCWVAGWEPSSLEE